MFEVRTETGYSPPQALVELRMLSRMHMITWMLVVVLSVNKTEFFIFIFRLNCKLPAVHIL